MKTLFIKTFALICVALFLSGGCKKAGLVEKQDETLVEHTDTIIGDYIMLKAKISKGPFNNSVGDYGNERISIISSGVDRVNVLDSLGGIIMTVGYSKEFNEENDYYSKNGEMFFGTYPYEDMVLYNVNSDTVTVIDMIHYGTSVHTYFQWKGLRIP